MFSRRFPSRRIRTVDPYFRGQQDAVVYSFPRNPFRNYCDEWTEYEAGFNNATLQLPPAYVSNMIPKDGQADAARLIWAGPQPLKRR